MEGGRIQQGDNIWRNCKVEHSGPEEEFADIQATGSPLAGYR